VAAASPPRVSILLPTHNRADVIGFAIQSVLAQTFTDFELLVVGDGCTDDTAAVVRSFGDRRIKWFDLPKAPGVGYANRNHALRTASGDIIAYQAHDDIWLPDHLQLLVDTLLENEAEVAYSQTLDVALDGHITTQNFNLHDPIVWNIWRTKHIGYLPLCNIVHRRACFEKYGYWSERLIRGGDWELWMRVIARGGRQNLAYLPLPTTLHFVANWRRGSATWRGRLWRAIRARETADLPELQLALRAGVTEQEAAWRTLQAAPLSWARAVRRATQVDSDRRGTRIFRVSNLLELAARTYRTIHPYYKQWPRNLPPDSP